jgi:hypothetical protein
MMNLDPLSNKQLGELERLARELLSALRDAKLQEEPVAEALRAFEREVGNTRRARFDESNPEYHGY